MGGNETQVNTSQPAPGLLKACNTAGLMLSRIATSVPPKWAADIETAIRLCHAAIAEEEQKRATFTAVFHSVAGRMPTEAELRRCVIDFETRITEPDHAARLREAAPELWELLREVAACRARSPEPAGLYRAVQMPRSLLNRIDAIFDELQPTEPEQ